MAEEAHYSSATDSATNKRKYEDQTTPPSTRRATGFSAPIAPLSPDSAPPSYNNVPPPTDEIQIAKQRAQEIAARLFNNASAGAVGAAPLDAKRPRVENGGFDSNDSKGFSSAPPEVKPLISNSAPSAIPISYGGFQGSSKKIDIPNGRVGVIIGKGGETIKYLQVQSGAKIQVTRDADSDPGSTTRMVELMGNPEQISKAESLIKEVLSEAETGGSGSVGRRLTGSAGSEQFVMRIPNNKVGLVIGKGGETIKSMQAQTGARIQVIPLHLPPGDTSTERTVQIEGTSEQIESAKQLVGEVISENRSRNPAMSGGYSQQGYQARPTSWGQPGAPVPQSGYGYVQPGAYPGPSPQYNMTQQPYAGYPPQPTSGSYSSSWDQSNAQSAQQTTPGGGYDYYSQQPPAQQQQASGAPSGDNSGYNYNQPPASGYSQQAQGYQQDGYGGYQAPQSGYGQPAPYDQQGYNSAASYGNAANPTQEGHTASYGSQGDSVQAPPSAQSAAAMGQQGYSTGQQPSPGAAGYPSQGAAAQPGYGIPPASQTGYGNPPTQSGYGPAYGAPQGQKPVANPPAYGQAQQSPSNPGSYGQPAPAQPGYPHSQPPASGYSQPDSVSQRAPASSYGAVPSQPGYGAPAYGAAPASQPAYGQAAAASYNSYGSGYSQPPVYAADGSAAPASQTVAKASPQS